MPKRTSDHGKHNRTPLLGGLKDSMNALAADLGLSKPKKHDTNPFGDALREISERKGGIIDELTRHAVALSPVIKRRTFPELENVPEGLVLGWAQLPSTRGRGFSLGIFPDRDHFAQVAFADTHGRVFVGTDPNMDVQDMQARFMFGKEKEVTLPDGERLGESDEPRSRSGFSRAGHGLGSALHHGRGLGRGLGHGADGVKAITGGVVGRDDTGRMTWLASWLKAGNRYTLEQMRANLPPAMRHDLEYRDAITIAFFATYMLPQINGLLIGFGSGNIFRRLNREAPIGAIRRSVRDTLAARAHGMRASVFKGMWDTSPRFRKEMLWRLTWSINHRLTREWIAERVRHYAGLEKEAGLECFDENLALSYLFERRAELPAETVRELGAPETVACRVQSPEPLVIDGETWGNAYEGIYFAGQTISLEAPPGRAVSHWEVDGREIREPRLELELHADTCIRAIFPSD